MQEKYKNIILFVFVFLIWGYFFRQFFSSIDNSSNIDDTNQITPILPSEKKETFKYELSLDYKNPFIYVDKAEKVSEPKIGENSSKVVFNLKPQIKPQKKEIIHWANVAYKGWVKKQNSYKNSAILEINGIQEKVREGETIENIKLLKVWQDSILLNYKDSLRYLKLFD